MGQLKLNGVEFESESMKIGETLVPLNGSLGLESWIHEDVLAVLKRVKEKGVIVLKDTFTEDPGRYWTPTKPERPRFESDVWHYDAEREALILRSDVNREEETAFIWREQLVAAMIENRDMLSASGDLKLKEIVKRLASSDPSDLKGILTRLYYGYYYGQSSTSEDARALLKSFFAKVNADLGDAISRLNWIGRKGDSVIVDNSINPEIGEADLLHCRMPKGSNDRGGHQQKANIVLRRGVYQMQRFDNLD
jgi:hypothetical protein